MGENSSSVIHIPDSHKVKRATTTTTTTIVKI